MIYENIIHDILNGMTKEIQGYKMVPKIKSKPDTSRLYLRHITTSSNLLINNCWPQVKSRVKVKLSL
jgi:hypothetical protein